MAKFIRKNSRRKGLDTLLKRFGKQEALTKGTWDWHTEACMY